jgi:hypothetical protein
MKKPFCRSHAPVRPLAYHALDLHDLADHWRRVGPAGKPGYRVINVILAAFTGTIPVNVDTVAHGAQVAGSRATLAPSARRLRIPEPSRSGPSPARGQVRRL